ncbi:MAG: glutamate 5-kinase [Candidatus Saelkia tenebricola]|nr:glutamate 5-kinase [Candidatus Saelkia tenebricola]
MYKKIVIKIGSSVLRKNSSLNLIKFKEIAHDISQLNKSGQKIILVTSGAIASGMSRLDIKTKPRAISKLQAIASLGQIELMKLYQEYFAKFKLEIGQVLLSWDDFSSRRRYLNARDTISELLSLKIVPVINENDALTIEEIKLGDNDRLSAMVAALVEADLLLMLSDVDGIYDSNGELIKEVDDIKKIKKYCFDTSKDFCVGGMITKIEAAEIATALGIPCIISNGNIRNAVLKTLANNSGTYIKAARKLSAKKHWLAYLSKPKGGIIIDAGAKEAVIQKNKSILPRGIVGIKGSFDAGDLVTVFSKNNLELARGITSYASNEISKIKGKKTQEIMSVLGEKRADEIIHRNNLVLTGDA